MHVAHVALTLDTCCMQETERLSGLIQAHDIVVSLVPAPCHPAIAKVCIAHKKHMVTASYIAPDMQALHAQAAAARVIILNEAGLDPGIDHMSAKKMIDEIQEAGGTITGFSSGTCMPVELKLPPLHARASL